MTIASLARLRTRWAALVLPLVMVALAASAGCDIAMADFKQKETAEWKKSYELQPGGRLEISNVNGRIEVEPGAGNTVEIVARKTARAASVEAARQVLERVEIQETVSPSNIRLETKVPRGGSLFNHGSVEVHYIVRMPAGADAVLTTVNGGIEITGLSGTVEAETTNGGIKAHEVSGRVSASTTNGGVEVDLSQISEAGVRLSCTNGGIVVRLPALAKATISARVTNGGIDTSGLSIETSGDTSRRRLDGRLNGGGPRIDLEGTNGGIRISGR